MGHAGLLRILFKAVFSVIEHLTGLPHVTLEDRAGQKKQMNRRELP
jgi:hypothetical protein